MDDDQLTKLAVEELIKEGQKFVRKRELTYTFDEPARMRPNLRYFKNTLHSCLSSNNRIERVQKSGAARIMQDLKNEQINKKVGDTHRTRKSYSRSCRESIVNEENTSDKSEQGRKKTKLNDPEKEVSASEKNCFPGTSNDNNKKKGTYRKTRN